MLIEADIKKQLITDEIKKIVKDRVDNGYAPAIVMATVSKNSKKEYYEYGSLSYREPNASVSKKTIFEIGSITKTFTGILLADLVLKKKIDIDDSIAKYFPELKNIKKITLRHLVTHFSGLPTALPDNFIDSETLKGDPWKNYSNDKLFKWLEGLNDKQLLFIPGSKFDYCNWGMGLLGCLLSKVYEKPYEVAIAEIILEPLEMTETHFSPTLESQKTQFAVPHFGEHEVPAWNLQKSIAAAGGLRSITQDFTKYIKAQLGLTHQDTPIGKAIELSHSALFQVDEKFSMCYGIGMVKVSTADGKLKNTWYTHDGGTGGSVSSLILDLEKQIGGVMFCNAKCDENLEILQGAIFPEILPEIIEDIKSVSPVVFNQANFPSLCGEYVKNDYSLTIINQNKALTLHYNEHYRMEYNKLVSAQETFYPTKDDIFFSKSSDSILKADVVNFGEEDECQVLKIGDIKLKKFKHSLGLDLRFSIYKDCLIGETLWVRPVFPGDYDCKDMIDCFSNKKTMKYVGDGTTYESDELKRRCLIRAANNLSGPQTGVWSIITRDGLVGRFDTLPKIEDTDNCQTLEILKKTPEIEVAFVIHPRFSGRGITTEAGKLILSTKFIYPNFQGKIIATAHPDNKASQRVLEKLGLKPIPNKQHIFIPEYKASRNFYEYSTIKVKQVKQVKQAQKPAILTAFSQFKTMLEYIEPNKQKLTQKLMTVIRNKLN